MLLGGDPEALDGDGACIFNFLQCSELVQDHLIAKGMGWTAGKTPPSGPRDFRRDALS